MSIALAFSEPREFGQIYRSHHGFVWHALHRFGLVGASIEDAVQDVFIVAYRRRDAFTGSMKAWLYAIARRVASNHRRARRRHDARTEAYAQVVSPPRTPLPEAIIELDRHLDGLTAQERELFVLSEIEGMTGPEIAAALGLNLNTAYTRIRKLRASLPAVAPSLRAARPQASARGWAALMPCLDPLVPSVAVASGLGTGWVVGIVATVVVSVGGGAMAIHASGGATSDPGSVVEERTAVVDAPELPPPAPITPQVTASKSVAPPPEPPAPASAPVGSTSRPSSSRGAPPEQPSSLRAQNALLQRAQLTLRDGDAPEAMRLLDEHATTFPNSAISDVRAVVRIEALCALGKDPQAKAEARSLLERRPTIAARGRLEKSCAAPPQNPKPSDMTGT